MLRRYVFAAVCTIGLVAGLDAIFSGLIFQSVPVTVLGIGCVAAVLEADRRRAC